MKIMKSKSNHISYRFLSSLVLILFLHTIVSGQVLNDDCQFARSIPSVDNYCSNDGEFTNVGASPDIEPPTNNCIGVTFTNGVWFSFVPKEPAILIKIFESGSNPLNTINGANILLYSDCGNYLSCSKGNTGNTVEFVETNLTIGKVYYVLITSNVGGEGAFSICFDDFVPTPSPESDCNKGVVLCSKEPFKVESVVGTGNVNNEIESGNCLFGNFPDIDPETASTWYKWTCETAGSLTFTLTPNNFINRSIITTDLDFALYEMPGGLDDCANKILLRCVAAGEDAGTALSSWADCNGPTGLREGEIDETERNGCKLRNQNNNGFVAPINMVVGKSYVLIINNFTENKNGFAIEFGGTGTFLGPKPDFEVNAQQAFECDKNVTFINTSSSETDPIVSYTWNFGNMSLPNVANGVGPFSVLYQSFGEKTAALTVESSRGCTVTKIIDLYVDPCCKDTSTLDLNASILDLRCFNIPEGQVLAQGTGGSPEYMYNIDGGPYQPNPLFGQLAAGEYLLSVYDIKGCRDTIVPVIVNQPPPIIVDAGEEQTINLGETTTLFGDYTSFNGVDSLNWTPDTDFEINGIANPEVFPKTTTTYTFTVTDENGCTEEDMVTIRVEKNYEIHAPNIFSPDTDNPSGSSLFNNFFNVWANNGVKHVELLEVYDRWGNLVYQGQDIRIGGNLVTNDDKNGWDGKFNDKLMNPGVFAWRAKVVFIDDFVKDFAGDLTLYR